MGAERAPKPLDSYYAICNEDENALASISGTTQISPVAHLGRDGHMAYGVSEYQSGQSEFRPHRIKQLISSIRNLLAVTESIRFQASLPSPGRTSLQS